MREDRADAGEVLRTAKAVGAFCIWLQPLHRRINQHQSRHGIRMTHGISADDEAAERMADEDAALAGRNTRNHGRELLDDSVKGSRTGRHIAPRQTGAVVCAHARELCQGWRDRRPTQGRGSDAGFEDDRWSAGPAARHVQPVTTDIDQLAWRRKPAQRGATGGALVEACPPRRAQRARRRSGLVAGCT